MKMSTRSLAIALMCCVAAAALPGCASLTQAGNTAYTLEPAVSSDGKPSGQYKFSVNDGKEFSSRTIGFTQSATGAVSVVIDEGASSAFQGQAIAGKALSVLPSFAAPLLGPGPATVVPAIQQSVPIGPDNAAAGLQRR